MGYYSNFTKLRVRLRQFFLDRRISRSLYLRCALSKPRSYIMFNHIKDVNHTWKKGSIILTRHMKPKRKKKKWVSLFVLYFLEIIVLWLVAPIKKSSCKIIFWWIFLYFYFIMKVFNCLNTSLKFIHRSRAVASYMTLKNVYIVHSPIKQKLTK